MTSSKQELREKALNLVIAIKGSFINATDLPDNVIKEKVFGKHADKLEQLISDTVNKVLNEIELNTNICEQDYKKFLKIRQEWNRYE